MKNYRLAMLLILTVTLMICAGPFLGSAEGQNAKKADDWTGVYAGLNLGGGIGSMHMNMTNTPPGGGAGDVIVPSSLSGTSGAVIGGGQIGFLRQDGRFVWGVEADIQGSGMNVTESFTGNITDNGDPGPNSTLSASEKTNYFGTVRVRFGGAVSRHLLLYGTAGAAYADVDYKGDMIWTPPSSPTYPAAGSAMKAGWTAGGGMEYRLCSKWSLRGEYLFYDLGPEAISSPRWMGTGYFNTFTMSTKAHIVRAAFNYRF